MPSAWTTTVCYEGGLIGYFLQWWFAAWLPLFVWWALFGKLADPQMRSYFLLYYNTYIPGWIFGIVLRDVVIRTTAPNPSCSSMLYTLPSIEMLLLTQYYTMGVLHHLALRLGISWGAVFRLVLTMGFVFGMLIWSGFYDIADLFSGIGFGMLFGLFFFYWIYDFWLPRYPIYDGLPLLKRLTGDMKYIASPHDIPLKKRQKRQIAAGDYYSRRKHLEKWTVL